MILKIFKAIWFLSLMTWLVMFLYIYASLPEQVIVRQAENKTLLSREAFFYGLLAAVVLVNGLVFIVSRLFHETPFLTWFYGLVICLHFFFVIVLNFINLVNSGEKYDYDRLGFVIYGSMMLFVLWAMAWPVYSVFRKYLSKELV